MKRLYFFATFVLCAATLSAQTYFEDDFEGGSLTANNAWSSVVISASASNFDWILNDFDDNFYAYMNNYNGSGNEAVETWLFSPQIDLAGSAEPTMSFDNVKRFSGTNLEVYVSTDFDGTGDPLAATWTEITAMCNLDSDESSWDFVNTGEINLTAYASATFTLGFRYQGGSSDGSVSQIDNISIVENGIVSVEEITLDVMDIYPNPATDQINLNVTGNHDLFITDISGRLVDTMSLRGQTNISLAGYDAGIYFFTIDEKSTRVVVQ